MAGINYYICMYNIYYVVKNSNHNQVTLFIYLPISLMATYIYCCIAQTTVPLKG